MAAFKAERQDLRPRLRLPSYPSHGTTRSETMRRGGYGVFGHLRLGARRHQRQAAEAVQWPTTVNIRLEDGIALLSCYGKDQYGNVSVGERY